MVPFVECTELETFSLSDGSKAISPDGAYVEVKLPQELLLEVGGNGIIGRRISMSSGDVRTKATIAEGIVGFNTGFFAPASL